MSKKGTATIIIGFNALGQPECAICSLPSMDMLENGFDVVGDVTREAISTSATLTIDGEQGQIDKIWDIIAVYLDSES